MERARGGRQGGWSVLGWGGVVFGVNLALRWGVMGFPQEWVFDEVYYVPFAADYLSGKAPFDLHPPLGKHLIAGAIALFYTLFPDPSVSPLNPTHFHPWSYRWLNGLLGALMPLAAGWATWVWTGDLAATRRRAWAIGAMVATSLDGFALVESRLALLHPALLLGGWLGLGTWGMGRDRPGWQGHGWRCLSGIFLGLTLAVKWNGAAYGLALALGQWGPWGQGRSPLNHLRPSPCPPWVGILTLGIIPLLVYSLVWWPHAALSGENWWAIHQARLGGHLGLDLPHPYASPWWQWPLGQRPIAYFYQAPTAEQGAIALYGVGNPALWSLALAALVPTLRTLWRRGDRPGTAYWQLLALTYAAHWLPWAGVSRVTFLYLYQPAILAAEVALVGWGVQWWSGNRWLVVGMGAAVIAGFLPGLPIWLGWPLPPGWLGWAWLGE